MMNNIQNGGLIINIQDDIICNKLSGKSSIGNIDIIPWFINYDDNRNYIYYSNVLKDNYLCRLDLDIGEEVLLLKEPVYLLTHHDGQLYYINEKNNNLYSYDVGNKRITKIIDDAITTFYIDGNTIWYSGKKGIMKMNISDGHIERFDKESAISICKYKDLVCFINNQDYSVMYLYQGELHKIEEGRTTNVNIYDDCIFYINASDKSHIYRYSIENEFNIKFIPERAQYIHIIKDVMYYFNLDTKEWKYVSILGGKPEVLIK